MKFKIQHIIAMVVAVMAAWFVWEASTQPGVSDLAGEPVEIAFVRNENNTGPVKRVYVVAIEDTLWQEMQRYGSYMPHNKYGNTQVYFFLKAQPAPTALTLESPIETQFQQYCMGRYEKDAMGNESFTKYPFSAN
ncbi:hypothetical protein OKW21_006149 [Catalinimonas alkaloidigena]|uniref:hypothetical protein n=1 Tax=Catalinimonas alkaloidigena TaxID=1075417 RepID=UPI002404BD68|nr:hypothetical protein [Catalinimonas alkaloidigena]MDF9800886.1 hypothetical protein [Catalinimonas alkaloidigena]